MKGLCVCGCGEPTKLATRTDATRGWRRGEPLRFVYGHQHRARRGGVCLVPPNPDGLCFCGCGETTPVARESKAGRHWQVAGEHLRYIRGHRGRLSGVEYVAESRGFETPCWIWQRALRPDGYGKAAGPAALGWPTMFAHRMVYEREVGPIPVGHHLHHRCEQPACVRAGSPAAGHAGGTREDPLREDVGMAAKRKPAKMSATSRDPEEWKQATEAARAERSRVAREVAENLSQQVGELIVTGDIMGGRSLLAQRLRSVMEAESRGDDVALRAALMDVAVSAGVWVAALDFDPPALAARSSDLDEL